MSTNIIDDVDVATAFELQFDSSYTIELLDERNNVTDVICGETDKADFLRVFWGPRYSFARAVSNNKVCDRFKKQTEKELENEITN